jgi:APA family basic amino acid/polyamine antiporter
LAFADYLSHAFPALRAGEGVLIGSGAFSLRIGAVQVVALTLIAAFTALNCVGVGRTAKVQNVLTTTKLVMIVVFVLLAFTVGSGSWSHFSEPAVRTSKIGLPPQFVISLLWVMFGYSACCG